MTARTWTRDPAKLLPRRAKIVPGSSVAGWVDLMGRPRPEGTRSRHLAHLGGFAAIGSIVIYVTWRILFTIPDGGFDRTAAWILIAFEAFPVIGVTLRLITLWNIDSRGPDPVYETGPGNRVVVFIPTYNEPVEVIAPTIAAACALKPVHQTWVLDDGDRPWVAEMCQAYGARYVSRPDHDHAKAGNMNHALDLMTTEVEAGAEPIDIIAVLDCDHVPMPTFLTDTIGWFDDPGLALIQAPQTYYNGGAFDDDGETGEQGVFFHVMLPGRNHEDSGPFWCGSTSLIRTTALQEVGGVATDTIVEDMHTTLGLIKAGWRTTYHHQVLAVGLAPDTADQYLLQRRRWGMGSMQVLTTERLWSARRWLNWRNYYEYLGGALWWLEGIATVGLFTIPAAILLTGARTSTASPIVFMIAFVVMFSVRLWGSKRLFRGHLHWPTAFAMRILRIPIGISCLWWLITRKTLAFQVTPKSGVDERVRGRTPRVIVVLMIVLVLLLVYAFLGVSGIAPWHVSPIGALASGSWLVVAGTVLVFAAHRIRASEYASSRRNAHRVPVRAIVTVDGVEAELVDLSVGGAAVRCPKGSLTGVGTVELVLPGSVPITMETVRLSRGEDGSDLASLRVIAGDWLGFRATSLWLFHTPPGLVEGLPDHAPAVAARTPVRRRSRRSVLARQHG